MFVLCLAQGFLPKFFPYDGKGFSRITLKLLNYIDTNVHHGSSPVVHNVEPEVLTMISCTCSMHLLSLMSLPLPSEANTIMEPMPQPLCTDRNARFGVSDFQIDAHGAQTAAMQQCRQLLTEQLASA